MKERQAGTAGASRVVPRLVVFLFCVAVLGASLAPSAGASIGYAPDSTHPSVSLPGYFTRGFAVEQATGDLYVAATSTNLSVLAGGAILRYNSNLSPDGKFADGDGYYNGVAPNLVSGGFFASQMELRTIFGNFGTSKMERYDENGTLLGSFPITFTDSVPTIVSDTSGRIYIPNLTTHAVQVYSSAGTLLQELTCTGCPGGSFGKPASIAMDAAGNLYVADIGPDRVVKLVPSGGSFAFSMLVQSGRGAGAVAVDPGSGDIFVGDMPGAIDFHVVAYDSSGVQFDDFGAGGMFPDLSERGYGTLSAYQMAVNGTTHKLYVGSKDNFYAFEKATIPLPGATIASATGIEQLGATLNATANVHGHAAIECEFEYTDEADFLANEFSNALTAPCLQYPDGPSNTAASAKVAGLSPGSKYRYRITLASNGGSATSGAAAFETLAELPPVAKTEAAQSVTESSAKIFGKVNPKGGTVSNCHFEWGAGLSYGTNLSCVTPSNGASTEVTQSRPLTGLSPGTTYHFRLVITTNAGTAEGDDAEFTTVAPPTVEPTPQPTPTPEAAPPAPPSPPPVVAPPATRCGKGFRLKQVNGHPRCVKICRKGFRPRRSGGKLKCVRKKHPPRRQRRPHHA
jgi:hypothetical protein